MTWFSYYQKIRLIESIIDSKGTDEDDYDLIEKIKLIIKLDDVSKVTFGDNGNE